MNTPIGDRLFQDIPHPVAKFPENRPRDIEKSVERKKTKKINNTTKTCQSSAMWPTVTSSKKFKLSKLNCEQVKGKCYFPSVRTEI